MQKISKHNEEKEKNCKYVNMQVVFVKIGEIDTMNEKYAADVIVESRWIDTSIHENYDPNNDWNPQIYIENALQLSYENIKYDVKKIEIGLEITEKRIAKGTVQKSYANKYIQIFNN